MPRTHFRRTVAVVLSLVLGAGMAIATASAVQAAPSDDTALSSLTVSAGTFDQPFDPSASLARVTVPYDTRFFSFTPTAHDPSATIVTWNGSVSAPTASGTATEESFLGVGDNIMTATVTAQNGVSTKQYTIIVTKPAPPPPLYDLDLSNLTVSESALSPAFDHDVTSYSVDVPYETTSITFGATAVDSRNTVTVQDAGSGVTDETVALAVPANTVLITVTAPDQTTQVYTVRVERGPAPTADVDLAGIDLSNGTLDPGFDPAVQRYTVTVPYGVRTMQIGATAAVSDNTVTVNNVPIVDGVPVTVPLLFSSPSGFAVTVTADNGVQKIYTVIVTRDQPSSNAGLAGLSLTEGTLSPEFSNDETEYTATVPYLTTSTSVVPTVIEDAEFVHVNGFDTKSGLASEPMPLAVGANTITVTAWAEDGVTTSTHTIVVAREAPDLDLSALTVAGGTLSPEFDAATTEYTVAIPYPVTSLDMAAAAVDPDWTVQIQGTEAAEQTIPVPVGASTITVTVTAQHGESRDYTIAVTREAPSADATLSGITLSEGTLSPAFAPEVTDYTASVGYQTEQLEVGATLADETATLSVNGQDAASALVPLAVGDNTVTIVTTAQDGVTTITTTIVVTRQPAPSAVVRFDLGFKPGDPVANAPFTASGANLLPGSTATVTLHSAPVVLVTGTVQADGTIVLSGRLPASVEAGAHRLVFEGTALDGSPVTATAWFTALLDGTVGSISLTGPVAYVEPATQTSGGQGPGGKTSAVLASTGLDGSAVGATGAVLAALGVLLFVAGGLVRRRRSAA